MAPDIIRDSAFGHIVRIVTRNKVFQYPEERDPSFAIKYYNNEKTRNMARYGLTSRPDDASAKSGKSSGNDDEKDDEKDDSNLAAPPLEEAEHHSSGGSVDSADTRVPLDHQVSNVTGTRVDPEKGRDVTVVDWDGPDDPENPLNWSLNKKLFVTFEICLLTFGIYIGSAIYTAGLTGVQMQFGVSQVAATLGLSLFVAGYGLGKHMTINHPGLLKLTSRLQVQ